MKKIYVLFQKKINVLFLITMTFQTPDLVAQTDWHVGGNTLSANSSLGSNNNFSVILKTNNTERGRITGGGSWGIGTTIPDSKLHINSGSGQNAFRAQVNSATKLWVAANGGVTIGSGSIPPENGLSVTGNTGLALARQLPNYM